MEVVKKKYREKEVIPFFKYNVIFDRRMYSYIVDAHPLIVFLLIIKLRTIRA